MPESRIVGGEREPHAVLHRELRLEAFVQPRQISHAGLNAGIDAVQVLDTEEITGGWQNLHEPPGAGPGFRFRVEPAFLVHLSDDQRPIEAVLLGILLHLRVVG